MTSRFLIASILVAASFGFCAEQAQAQEGRAPGARFSFAKNVWKNEQARVPSDADGPRMVKQGAVPHSSNFLGLDPGMLNSRPQPLPQVAARPAVPSVSARAFVPNTNFNSNFGQPIAPLNAGAPMQMAALPAPAAAIPQMAAPVAGRTAAPVHHSRGTSHPHSTRTAVSGKLKTPIHPSGASATPATYGNNFGYVPGEHLPAVQIGSGTNSRADVHGRIVKSH